MFTITTNQKILTPKKIIVYSLSFKNIRQEMIGLTKRLYIQLYRRPSTFIAGIIQPLLWLIIFSALFQNIPSILFTYNVRYVDFLSPGIIIFTGFTGSINAGLPTIFDREFGFLNRLLVSPLNHNLSIILSSILSIWTITTIQIIMVIICNMIFLNNLYPLYYLKSTIYLATLIIAHISSISICLAFILPGHIELLALILITNLPILFSSTALAPLKFMPGWLQIITCFNPLTYAIEILRYLYINHSINGTAKIIHTVWLNLNTNDSIMILFAINFITFLLVKNIIKHKYE